MVCEIKFSINMVEMGVIQEVKNKIDRLNEPRGFRFLFRFILTV